MKKILTLILILLAAFSLIACGKNQVDKSLNTTIYIAENKADLTIDVTWDAVEKATGYTLYVSAEAGSEAIYRGSELKYSFSAELGKEYSFKVVPFSEKRNKEITGVDSNIITHVIGLDTPAISSISSDGSSVTLGFTPICNATVYAIYRSNDNKAFSKIGETVAKDSLGEDLYYIDNEIEEENTYYYNIIAQAGSVSSDRCDAESITIEKKKEASGKVQITNEMKALITEVYDRYYKTMADLKVYSGSDLFTTEKYGYLFDTSLKYLVTTRKMSSNDLTLKKYSYSLTYKSADYADGIYTIEVREDSKLNFSFLKDITSEQHNLKCIFYLKKVSGKFKVVKVDKEEGFAMNFYNNYDGSPNYKFVIDEIYDSYLETYTAEFNKLNTDRENVNSGKVTYVPKVSEIAYDREAAVAYAQNYWNKRNSDYKTCSSNCQNFVSQCLHAGGMEFDTIGNNNQTWYMLNSKTYCYAFTSISYFKKYLKNNEGAGMVLTEDVNLYLAEPGDIIQVASAKKYTSGHTILVVDVVKDAKGNVIDILINGNTNDQHNYPISAASYPYRVLVKVDGYNTK